jgi:DNA anti-recombination protein RmuC
MPDSLISQLLDFGALGIFAGFLIWQHLGMQKRLDKLVENFQAQLKEIDVSFESRVETMRGRYDAVFQKLSDECKEEKAAIAAERDALRKELAEIIKENDRKLTTTIEKIDKVVELAKSCNERST